MGSEAVTRTANYSGDATTSKTKHWARLIVVHPSTNIDTLAIPEGSQIVGREPDRADLVITHSTVSRRHFELRRDGSTILGLDIGSHNGSRLNGVEAGSIPRTLGHGDVLRFGEVVAVLEVGRGTLEDSSEVSPDAVPGQSAAACRLRARVHQVARDPSSVLLVGDSGTGKESTARELHRISGRAGPLVVTNCASLSATLIESQLFGHERGAFTGAVGSPPGLFRSAHGGSLFLDEVGELPLEFQPKLLRAVELGEVSPLGSAATYSVRARVISATNRDLVADVETGRFRRDLYARLSLFKIELAPLCERRADILSWVQRLYARWCESRDLESAPALTFSAEAIEAILLHEWPENLRGLDQLVHELGTQGVADTVTRSRLPRLVGLRSSSGPAPSRSPPARRARPDRDALVAALETHDYNVAAVAAAFGRDRKQIYRWVDALGIELKR